ncbi:MAG: putative sugar O-methyltransferase [Nitrospirae bacterium]|nr:putative sugar O-methyltransferase [Nitrospirota bacterium]
MNGVAVLREFLRRFPRAYDLLRYLRILAEAAGRIDGKRLRAATCLHVGRGFVRKGDRSGALRLFRKGLDLDPGLNPLHADLAELLQRDSFGDAAMSLSGLVDAPELRTMLADLAQAPVLYHPSKFWTFFATLNICQLRASGLANFKQTVNQNYFNWVLNSMRDQWDILGGGQGAWAGLDPPPVPHGRKPKGWTRSQWIQYGRFVALLWEAARSQDRLGVLARLEEPLLGNPMAVRHRGRLISQDLCNSSMEINAAFEGIDRSSPRPLRVAELGAGYGRIAFALLKAFTDVQIIILDIPPALHLAQWYLATLFPNRRVFRYRPAISSGEARSELEAAEIAFLAPHQVEQLPDKGVDVFLTVSTFPEMTPAQVEMWFSHIDRVCRGVFYFKQWIEGTNTYDGTRMSRETYPVRPHWARVFDRVCPVQTRYFEALCRVGPGGREAGASL